MQQRPGREVEGDDAPALGLGATMALLALGLSTWTLAHSYLGIFHDAGLYTLQALARLHPASLASDVFLRFGSQDHFTLFSAPFAAVIQLVGVDRAAAVLTFTLQLALVTSAWRLARAVMPAPLAVLAIAAVIAAPGDYGADRIFTYMEPFLTPRMAAESLVLASLVASLNERRTLAVALIAIAVLLHPLMATPGIAALLYRIVAVRKPLLAAAVVIVGVTAVVLTAVALPEGPWGRFDANWLAAVARRSPYLFLSSWQADDWSRTALPLATLTVGSVILPHRARALAQLGLWIGIAGLALTFIGCDALHVVRLTQLQPWRCLWLGALVAALLVPLTLYTLWHTDRPARSTALLLMAGWVFAGNLYGLAAVSLAALSLLPNRLRASEARWVYYGAAALLAIAVAWRLASNMQFTDAHYFDPHIPLWIRRAMSFTRDGSMPMTVIAAAWVLARRRGGQWPLRGVGAFGAILCVLLIPYTWARWTVKEFPAARIEQFAVFRQQVPPGEDVFWPELPIGAWVLLDRPSYLSVIQTSGLVFSRESARELQRRAETLRAAIDPRAFLEFDGGGAAMTLTPQQLNRICESGAVHYLVSGADLAGRLVADIAPAAGSHAKPLHLYRCDPGAG